MSSNSDQRLRRKARIRGRVNGTAERPRLSVFRSSKHIYAQVINDVLLAAQPTMQFVTPDQVAAMAVFLCSDAASQITGANLSMDGGWTAA